MDKEVLKSVLVGNQNEIPRHKVIPRKFDLEEFGNYVFVGIRWVWRFLRMDFAV
ncbi:MAG: hypothetical protein ACLTOV_01465 [Phocaeicola sp.]